MSGFLSEARESVSVRGLSKTLKMSLSEILSRDDPGLLYDCGELPFDILSLVINSMAFKCYSLLKNSPDFKKHVRNITHINPECVTSEMIKDFLESELGENENWVDLAIELKSAKLINKLGEKAAERIIKDDDAELFALIEDANIEEVFRRNKYHIAMSLRDERVEKISAETLAQGGSIRAGKFIVIEYGAREIPSKAFDYVHSGLMHDAGPEYIIIPPTVTTIDTEAFSWCTSLKSITIPLSVTEIGEHAFLRCTSLEAIAIPSGVTTIGDYMFRQCYSLKSVIIPQSVTAIGRETFYECPSLMSITFEGEVVGRIDCNLFIINNHTLVRFVVPSSECSINNTPFTEYDNIEEFVIPPSVTEIGEDAFRNCSSLKSIVIPLSVNTIGKEVFTECSSLESIVIPSSVTEIGDEAFNNCSSLREITIPSSVNTIGEYAFSGCSSLESITFHSGAIHIGDKAFTWCTSLETIAIPSGVTYIGDYMFQMCLSLRSVTFPQSVTAIGLEAFCPCPSLMSITFEGKVVGKLDCNLFIVNNHTLVRFGVPYYECTINNTPFAEYENTTEFIIPLGVTEIGLNGFSYCPSLRSNAIPPGVTVIGKGTFAGCYSLEVITIPSSVAHIGDTAFFGCSALKSITIPPRVTAIGDRVFSGCSSLKAMHSSLTRVERSAFSHITHIQCGGSRKNWLEALHRQRSHTDRS